MVDNVSQNSGLNAQSQFQLPAKPFADSAEVSVFGTVYEQNTTHYATLETAQALAAQLGGTVVDVSPDWGGGGQSPAYLIKINDNIMLNAGLIAQRCQMCGVDVGLNAARQEIVSLGGNPFAPSTVTPASTTPASTEPPAVASAAVTPASTEATTAAAPAPDSNSKLANVAKQFEGLIVAELLKSARESSQGSFYGTDEDNNSVSAAEMAEQALAQSLSANGGLGLSKLLLQGLEKSAAAT